MKTSLYNQVGEVVGEVQLPDWIFDVDLNKDLVHQALRAQLANSRQVIAHAKGRGEVRGGGKKPWRQKGTGRARHASIRSPIWKGGGVTFGPTSERNFTKKINKRMKQKALFMALSSKVKDNEIMVLDSFKLNEAKTKEAVSSIKNLTGKMKEYKQTKTKQDSILLVMPAQDKSVIRATNNLSFMNVMSAANLNIKDVLKNKYLILLQDSLPVMEQAYKLSAK
ncbi:MAG: 50S ribosomal protein L4 [Candidatus Paceibacterota bacterium]